MTSCKCAGRHVGGAGTACSHFKSDHFAAVHMCWLPPHQPWPTLNSRLPSTNTVCPPSATSIWVTEMPADPEGAGRLTRQLLSLRVHLQTQGGWLAGC